MNYTPDGNAGSDVFVRDLFAGTTEIVSLHDDDAQRTGGHLRPSITDDGRRVAFDSDAALVAGDTNGVRDVYLRDRVDATTERLSLRTDGGQGDGPSYSASINARGRYTAFVSEARIWLLPEFGPPMMTTVPAPCRGKR